jgi:hypothetical protein
MWIGGWEAPALARLLLVLNSGWWHRFGPNLVVAECCKGWQRSWSPKVLTGNMAMFRILLLIIMLTTPLPCTARMLVVTHHKTGTAASLEVVAALCCPDAYNVTRIEDFWGLWKTVCRKRCSDREPRVDFAFDGLMDRGSYRAGRLLQPDLLGSKGALRAGANHLRTFKPALEAHGVAGPAGAPGDAAGTAAGTAAGATAAGGRDLYDLTVVHFLRHPVDMVVSGYLYHKAGREPWTTAPAAGQGPLRIPDELLPALGGKSFSRYISSTFTYPSLPPSHAIINEYKNIAALRSLCSSRVCVRKS